MQKVDEWPLWFFSNWQVEAAVQHLLPSLDRNPVGVEGLRIHLLLMELLYVIQRHKQQQTSTKLAEAVAAAVLRLSDDSLQVIGTGSFKCCIIFNSVFFFFLYYGLAMKAT